MEVIIGNKKFNWFKQVTKEDAKKLLQTKKSVDERSLL